MCGSSIGCASQQLQLTFEGCALSNRVPLFEFNKLGSESKLSDIFSQIISTKRSNTAYQKKIFLLFNLFLEQGKCMAQGKCTYVLVKLTLTLTFSLADVSKNSKPNESANCFPRSNEITLSSSISHLLPTKTTCALSHEYVFIWVHLVTTIVSWRCRVNGNDIRRKREKKQD